MEMTNRLSENLKKYQRLHNQTWVELSEELSVPKTTLQSLLKDGNTTWVTLMRIQQMLGITLDELVYGTDWIAKLYTEQKLLSNMAWYMKMPEEDREFFRYHLNEMMKILESQRG